VIETERLILRPTAREDLDGWAELMADPEASRFIGGPVARGAAWRGMMTMAGSWALNGFAMSCIVSVRPEGSPAVAGCMFVPKNWSIANSNISHKPPTATAKKKANSATKDGRMCRSTCRSSFNVHEHEAQQAEQQAG
jgi:RimJ/RimL family protein N-acetyltransferase